ncbi:MAG: hypothetical protein KAH33_06670 [Candidatus Delongbacteria bacterium]|nr:hypothetical protein [Candidatus Delongbacteria bacterium]
MKIAVLGAGAWGLAIADILEKKEFPVSVWEFNKNICDELNNTRKVENKLPGYVIPKNIIISNDIGKLVNESQIIINAVPTQFIRSYFDSIKNIDFTEK